MAQKADPHATMLGNLRRLTQQAEDADAEGDAPLADGLWRAVQSHAKQISPFDPDAAIPVLERVMERFNALAADAQDTRRANSYHRLAQGVATDLAPLKLSRIKADTDVEEDPERVARERDERRARVASLMQEAETAPWKRKWVLYDLAFAEFDSRSLARR